jgi:hypothetical protein
VPTCETASLLYTTAQGAGLATTHQAKHAWPEHVSRLHTLYETCLVVQAHTSVDSLFPCTIFAYDGGQKQLGEDEVPSAQREACF